jgi:hypothetical protein
MFPQRVSDPFICKCQQICFSLFCEINISTKDIRTAYWCDILGSSDSDYKTVAFLGVRCPLALLTEIINFKKLKKKM